MASERIKLNLNALGEVKRADGKIYLVLAEDISVFEGKKGNYVDAVRWENAQPDQYGNTSSLQISQPKDSNAPKRYFGNGSPLKRAEGTAQAAPAASTSSGDPDLPF